MIIFRFSLLAGLGLFLPACSVDDPGRTQFGPKPLFDPIILPSSSTGSAIVPLPFDGLFGTDADASDDGAELAERDNNLDGTLDLFPLLGPASLIGPGLVDGWSTTANLFFDLVGPVDLANAADGIRIFDSARGLELQPDRDFVVQQSPAVQGRTRLIVHWLKPLQESTRYLIGLSSALRAPDGSPGQSNELFALLASSTPVAEQSTNTILAALTVAGRQADIAVLAALQEQLIAPVIAGLEALSGVAQDNRGALLREQLLLAWSFTTQSIRPTLEGLAAVAQPQSIVAFDSGLNLSQLLAADPSAPLNLPRDADVYVGSVALPYYLPAGPEGIPQGFWVNDGNLNTEATHPALGAPCTVLQRPLSTTICYPAPQQRSTQNVPLLLTRPAGNAPDGGWPVVIFVHGITGDRSNMLGVATALSVAGFVVIAIDQPLHGVAPGSPLRVPGTTERTFDADLDADGTVDASGTHFINLQSLASSRDNLRQSAIDQIHLLQSLGDLRLGAMADETLNTSQVRLVGHSLGGIVGTTVLALSDGIGAATLAMPGGGIAKLLDGSPTFGPVVAAGLAANGVVEGTDNFENFLRLAQLVTDPGDPINWAAQAAEKHPIHMLQVRGDSVVPNNVINNPEALVDGFLSGSDPLAEALGLNTTVVTAPLASLELLSGSQRIVFSAGNHSSIVRPRTANPADDAEFIEMQNQMTQFLASDGACLPVGGNCPQPEGASK